MQIRNKLFPYPFLNRDEGYSNFKNKFEMSFVGEETDTSYILKNLKIDTDSSAINYLLDNGYAKAYLIVECSYTVYREKFEIDNRNERTIELDKSNFEGNVIISGFVVAVKDFEYTPEEVDEDYKGINFLIEKYDILAGDDGSTLTIFHSDDENNLIQSIFSVQPFDDDEIKPYYINCENESKIVIYLHREDFNKYRLISAAPEYKEIFFNMILIPALIESIHFLKEELSKEDVSDDDLDELSSKYKRFLSILSSYEKRFNVKLTGEEFKDYEPLRLAQELLGKPLSSSLDILKARLTPEEEDE